MSRAACLVDGCAEDVFRRDLCKPHYRQLHRTGKVGDIRLDRPECAADDCAKLTRGNSTPYCEKHYYRVRRNGTLEAKPWHRRAGRLCSAEGCEEPDREGGMCDMHAARVRRHGDPSAFTHQRDRDLARGPRNVMWLGDEVGYAGAHRRVRKLRGKASDYPCADCGEVAAQWSYDHADPAERTSEIGPYSTDARHYAPRCISCHKKYDLAFLPPDHPELAFLEAVRHLHSQGVRVKPAARSLSVSTARVNAALDLLGLPRFRSGNPGRRPLADGTYSAVPPGRAAA